MLWTPPADVRETTQLGRYLEWLRETRGIDSRRLRRALALVGRRSRGLLGLALGLLRASAPTRPYERVLGSREMPGAEWFTGARLNYAEHMLGRDEDLDQVAVAGPVADPRRRSSSPSASCASRSARARAGPERLGVGRGDRVVAYLPEHPRDAGRVPGHGEPGRDLGDLRARVRRPQRDRPVRSARAQGAARGRRLHATARSRSTGAPRSRRSARRCPALERGRPRPLRRRRR